MNDLVPVQMLMAILLLAAGTSHSGDTPVAKETPDDCTASSLRSRYAGVTASRQESTKRETRAIALAIECYSVSNEKYPGPTPGVVMMGWLKNQIPELAAFPEHDVWGEAFRYWSDGNHYVVVSFSSDGKADHDYPVLLRRPWDEASSVICSGRTTETGADVVFADGNHCRWFDADGK